MKRILLASLLLTAGAAWAQQPAPSTPPREVTAIDNIELRVQETRTFRFDYSISNVTLSSKGVAEAVPGGTDRLLDVRGIGQGRTLLTIYSADGRVAYRANISVLQAGGSVRIYGQDDKSKDFTSYYCTGLGCGRANVDIPPTPYSTIFSDTKNNPDGSSSTVTREFR